MNKPNGLEIISLLVPAFMLIWCLAAAAWPRRPDRSAESYAGGRRGRFSAHGTPSMAGRLNPIATHARS